MLDRYEQVKLGKAGEGNFLVADMGDGSFQKSFS